MKNRLYIKPEMVEIHLALEGIICDSYNEMPIGGRNDNFSAPALRRNTDWDNYESQN